MSRILVAEISGKRPGTKKDRPTEKFPTKYDHVIISNNSEGYTTEWPIINVPQEYREWYIANLKNSDNAWYAPMNRSYAIKYARENGYDHLIQLDDNIVMLEIATFRRGKDGIARRMRIVKSNEMMDDFIETLVTVLENTNAAMAGCDLSGCSIPQEKVMSERFCYSLFALNLAICPDVFQGDFEDDIEYRLKCRQMGLPVIQVPVLRYGKTGQGHNKDLSGCRAEYLKAGLKRGEHMSKLYSDVYSCKMTRKRHSLSANEDDEAINFKHILRPFKVGCIVKDREAIEKQIKEVIKKYAEKKPDKVIVKVKKKKVKKNG